MGRHPSRMTGVTHCFAGLGQLIGSNHISCRAACRSERRVIVDRTGRARG
jgi:hypothetical protein